MMSNTRNMGREADKEPMSQRGVVAMGAKTPIIESLMERSSLRERVTEVLREAMVVGELEPETIYSAPAIAAKLGVSATPVREAMLALSREGLVEVIRHRGYSIKQLSDKTLEDISGLRALIEVPTVGRVAEVALEDEIEELRPIADELNRSAANGEFQNFIASDMTFHLKLLALAGNEMLVEEIRRLRGMTRLYGLRSLRESTVLLDTAHEHHQILDCLVIRDRLQVERLMERHLGHIRGVWAGKPES